MMDQLHQSLMQSSSAYRKWHEDKDYHFKHWAMFIAVAVVALVSLTNLINRQIITVDLFQARAATTITAASCNQTDVQNAVNQALDGDTVKIPAGTCSWDSTVTLNKSVTISGQTTTSRNPTTYQVTPTDRTIIQKNGFNVTATNDVRITGITFDGNVSGAATRPIVLPRAPVSMRIDHNHFSHYARTWNKGGGGGYLNVLFDHNRITQPGEENLYIVGAGNQSWIDAGTCGSENPEKTTWLEDNEWILETAGVSNPIDSGEGARVVLRNNRFSGTANYSFQLVSEAHGHFWGQRDGSDNAGTYCFESSNNKIFKTQSIGNNGENLLKTRAGKNYVYNNSLSTTLANAWGAYIKYWPQEADLGYATGGGCDVQEHEDMGLHDVPWGLPQFDGTHCVVYPCPMQPNNSYSWGNTWDNGTPSVIVQGTGTSDFMQEDRDYWDDIGVGDTNFTKDVSANRLATCTEDDAYWETDNNKLYRCISTDTWALEYTSYTYPHPLAVGTTDNTPPSVNITSPVSASTVSGSSVTVSADASDNISVSGVQFKLDGVNLQAEDASAPYSITWDTTASANGSHTLTATARDSSGNTAVSSGVTVTVNNVISDTTPPTVSITPPVNGSSINRAAPLTIQASASDDTGVSKVDFFINGTLKCTDTTAPYACSWNVPGRVGRTYRLQTQATDSSGNFASSGVITVIAK